ALGIVLFELVWGINYRRATIAERVRYSDARVTSDAVARFSERIVNTLNANVAAAVPKTTVLQPYYDAAGIGGQYSPFAFETLLNSSFLPVEEPRALAHEWAHVGGFTDEGDANYIGTLACLRSNDPLIRYSGAFWTYGDLRESERRRLRLDPR